MKALAKIADAFFKSGRISVRFSIEDEDIVELNIKKKKVIVKILSFLGSLGLATNMGLSGGLDGLSKGAKMWDLLREMGYELTIE